MLLLRLTGGFERENSVFADTLESEQLGQESEICGDIIRRKPPTNTEDQIAS
jgi:hypothetical protein